MAISENKVRTLITLDKFDKKALEEIARADGRSFNNLIVRILKQYIKSQDPRNR